MSVSVHTQKKAFFGGDGRANFFVAKFFPYGYTKGINESNPDDLKKESEAAQVMLAEWYEDKDRLGLANNDIHPQFSNFIFRTGLVHAKLEEAGTNTEKENFIREVYGKWNSLSTDAKDFYRAFIEFLKNGTPILENMYADEARNAIFSGGVSANYTLRLVREGSNIKFARFIPLLPSFVGKVCVYDDSRSIGCLSGALRSILQTSYVDALNGIDPTGGRMEMHLPNLPPQRMYEGFWVDLYVRRKLFAVKKHGACAPREDEKEEVFDFITKNVWKRSGGKLYTEIGGVKIWHDENSKEFVDLLSADNKCYTTSAYADKDKCREFMFECLLNCNDNKIRKCIDAMNKADFFVAAKTEINKMTPMVALNLLKRFGFREHLAYDMEANQKLNKIESVQHWLNNYMKRKFPDATDQNAIMSNDRILYYLKLVVEFVNANPSILNSNYSGSTEESVGNVEKYVGEYAKSLGIPVRRDITKDRGLYDLGMLESTLKTGLYGSTLSKPMLSVGLSGTGLLRSPFGEYVSPGFGTIMPVMAGGNPIMDAFARRVQDGSVMSGSQLLTGILYALKRQMQNRGKVLGKKWNDELDQKLKAMAQMEKQMVINLKYIAEYNDLIEMFGEYKSETLSEKTLKDIVNSHANLYTKHGSEEKSMIAILKALQNLAYGYPTSDAEEIGSERYQELDPTGATY